MKNPFKFGVLVKSNDFCNRQQELKDLTTAMKNGVNVFLYAERRTGKTSLAKKALAELPTKQFLTVYVDLWPSQDESDFSVLYAKAMAETFNTTLQNMVDWIKKNTPAFYPSITLNSQGQPEVILSAKSGDIAKTELSGLLDLPNTIARERQKSIIVVFDEFQQMLDYPSDIAIKQLRSHMQKHESVSYVFLGSRKHLIQSMLLDRRQPLFGSGDHHPIGPIAERHWVPYIQERFQQADATISVQIIHNIMNLSQGHPYYTQLLCHHLWNSVEETSEISEQMLSDCVLFLLDREDYAYSSLWESLARNQKQVLQGVACEQGEFSIQSKDFLQKYNLANGSSAKLAADALLRRDILDRAGSAYVVSDRLLRLWIRRRFSGLISLDTWNIY